jgi:hypothetical protein
MTKFIVGFVARAMSDVNLDETLDPSQPSDDPQREADWGKLMKARTEVDEDLVKRGGQASRKWPVRLAKTSDGKPVYAVGALYDDSIDKSIPEVPADIKAAFKGENMQTLTLLYQD